MKTNQFRLAPVLIALLAATTSLPSSAAAEDFKAGEPVGFPHNGTWHVGTVVAVERGRIKIRAELDGKTSQGVFGLQQVARPPGTTGYRFWSDASKSFQIKAALVDVDDKQVRLRKAQGDEISVPIAKLSQKDQELAKRLHSEKQTYLANNAPKETPAASKGPSNEPTVDSATKPMTSSPPANPRPTQSATVPPETGFGPVKTSEPDISISLDASAETVIQCAEPSRDSNPTWDGAIREPISLASSTDSRDLPAAIVSYQAVPYELFKNVLPVGDDPGWCLINVRKQYLNNAPEAALRWVSMVNKVTSNPIPIIASETLLDYDKTAEHALVGSFPEREVMTKFEAPDHWSIYKLSPGDTDAKLVARLSPSRWNEDRLATPWGRLLSGNRAVLYIPGRILLVDYAAGKTLLAIQLPGKNSLPNGPKLSPDKRFLLFRFRTSKSYRMIVDLDQRKVVQLSRDDSRNIVADNFSPDGKHIISAAGSRFVWYDLQTWKIDRSEPIDFGVGPGHDDFHILNDRFLISSDGGLVDLKYDRHTVRTGIMPNFGWSSTPRETLLHNDGAVMARAGSRGVNYVAYGRLPGPEIENFLEQIASDPSFKTLRRGDSVRFELPDVQAEKVKAVFEAICDRNGWIISADSNFVLAARETIPPIYRARRQRGDLFLFVISVRAQDQVLWSTHSTDYLMITPNSVSFAGAVYGDLAHGACPAGLEVPETIVGFRTKSGVKSIGYNLKTQILGGKPTSFATGMKL